LRQQASPIVVYANEITRVALSWLDTVLQHFCGIDWRDLNDDSLGNNLAARQIELQHSRAFHISDKRSGKKVLIAPAVQSVTQELRNAAQNSDAVFFDGTFWSDNELQQFRRDARTARQMHHLAINDGALEFLRSLPGRKFYTHINNTNPILMPESPEHAVLKKAGIELAYDGLELTL
jgi:pyrroloquinoline quinone biosynthesis protein B